MKTLILYPLLSVFLSSACNSTQKVNTPEKSPEPTTELPTTTTTTTTTTTQSQDKTQADTMYRFIVSFISIGEGTDPKAREMMDGVLKQWEAKTGKTIMAESVPWGREGEVDFCYKLDELNDKQQSEFVSDMRKTFEGKSLVQLSENQPCSHKR